jgi:Fe-S oxidoreductase
MDPISLLERASDQNVWACYQCGKCTADCPFSLTPNLVVRLVQLGDIRSAQGLATTWECASCYACQTECPMGVSPARLMRTLREMNGGSPHTLTLLPGAPPTAGGPAAVTFTQTLCGDRQGTVGGWKERVRARLLADMPRYFRLGSRLAPLSNWLARVPGVRLGAHALLGIHRQRPLPRLATQPFPRWFHRHVPTGDGSRGKVVLFHDTFTDFNHPQVGQAATRLLETAGFQVELTATGCCGRPAISKGVHDIAERCARQNIPALYEQVRDGDATIVGIEPSCLLTLRDEYLHLAPDLQEQARVVAAHTLLIDEFLSMLHEKGELGIAFRQPVEPLPVLFHGHCHQKAFADPLRGLELLRAAGYQAELVNAACCGMAGAYGYEREHYEPSRTAGERALFPALRADPDAEVVVMGVSCRQQIEHFLGRPVRHLVEAMHDAIA